MNFYPLYDGANDQVDAVLPIRPVLFQKVLPRYRLSTSETRDQGVGPLFTEVSTNRAAAKFRKAGDSRTVADVRIAGARPSGTALATTGSGEAILRIGTRGGRAQLEARKGSSVDLLA